MFHQFESISDLKNIPVTGYLCIMEIMESPEIWIFACLESNRIHSELADGMERSLEFEMKTEKIILNNSLFLSLQIFVSVFTDHNLIIFFSMIFHDQNLILC